MRASVVLGPARYIFPGAGIFKSALTEMICYISRIAAFHFSGGLLLTGRIATHEFRTIQISGIGDSADL